MSGITLCPHCDTRFRIAEAQLEAHHGMVRCGHCLQAFDANRNFVPDQPDPQLELPMLDEPVAPTAEPATDEPADRATAPTILVGVAPTAEPATDEPDAAQSLNAIGETVPTETPAPEELVAGTETEQAAPAYDEMLDFSQPAAVEPEEASPSEPVVERPAEMVVLQPMTLAEQVAIIKDAAPIKPEAASVKSKRRTWLWTVAASLLLLALLAQAAYFFRVDLAARLPGLKPALIAYCKPLKCEVPLPRNADLMSIESSDLEADPANESQITLNTLLRNRATYTQAFPNLELTLNDTLDKPLARRVFRPADYLPPVEKEQTGLLPNHELSVRLRLDTTDLKPSGYRLVLFYPQ